MSFFRTKYRIVYWHSASEMLAVQERYWFCPFWTDTPGLFSGLDEAQKALAKLTNPVVWQS